MLKFIYFVHKNVAQHRTGAMPTSENSGKAKFAEFSRAEVRRIPKFSGSWAVASRNRLLRFLALFVATWSGYRGRSGSCTQKGDSFEGGSRRLLRRTSENTPYSTTYMNTARSRSRLLLAPDPSSRPRPLALTGGGAATTDDSPRRAQFL